MNTERGLGQWEHGEGPGTVGTQQETLEERPQKETLQLSG